MLLKIILLKFSNKNFTSAVILKISSNLPFSLEDIGSSFGTDIPHYNAKTTEIFVYFPHFYGRYSEKTKFYSSSSSSTSPFRMLVFIWFIITMWILFAALQNNSFEVSPKSRTKIRKQKDSLSTRTFFPSTFPCVIFCKRYYFLSFFHDVPKVF